MSEELTDTILPVADGSEVVGFIKTQEEADTMLALHRHGHSPHWIAQLMHCSRNTVTRYFSQSEWRARRRPAKRLDGLDAWLTERFLQHDGNADVVRFETSPGHQGQADSGWRRAPLRSGRCAACAQLRDHGQRLPKPLSPIPDPSVGADISTLR